MISYVRGGVIRWVFNLMCWEIVKDREEWHAAVHGVTKKSYTTY